MGPRPLYCCVKTVMCFFASVNSQTRLLATRQCRVAIALQCSRAQTRRAARCVVRARCGARPLASCGYGTFPSNPSNPFNRSPERPSAQSSVRVDRARIAVGWISRIVCLGHEARSLQDPIRPRMRVPGPFRFSRAAPFPFLSASRSHNLGCFHRARRGRRCRARGQKWRAPRRLCRHRTRFALAA